MDAREKRERASEKGLMERGENMHSFFCFVFGWMAFEFFGAVNIAASVLHDELENKSWKRH